MFKQVASPWSIPSHDLETVKDMKDEDREAGEKRRAHGMNALRAPSEFTPHRGCLKANVFFLFWLGVPF